MQTNSTRPYFSIVILQWKNESYLHKCLSHLNDQVFQDFEIILVNNGAPNLHENHLDQNFPNLHIKQINLVENIGFAAGNNLAARNVSSKYIVLLNADAFAHPDWLRQIYEASKRYPKSFFASRLVMANQPSLLDGEGDIYHASGLAWRKSYGMPNVSKTMEEKVVFSACGAAAIYPKDKYDQVGGFDEDFFSYLEDVDLGFRLRLIGLNCVYVPSAIVHHVGSASTGKRSKFAIYYGQRNMVWTFFKNMPWILFWVLLPFHFIANIFVLVAALFRKEARIVCKAKIDAILSLPRMLSKRKVIQASRIIPLIDLIKYLDWNPISPLSKIIRR